MARTPSTMLPLGTQAPDFRLPDFAGQMHALADFQHSRALLVAFICSHCPFVRHIRGEFARYAREYQPRGLAVVAINPRVAVTVVDVDDSLLEYIDGQGQPSIRCLWADLRFGLPAGAHEWGDLVFTDPPYTPEGVRLFLARGLTGLEKVVRENLSYPVRRVSVWERGANAVDGSPPSGSHGAQTDSHPAPRRSSSGFGG